MVHTLVIILALHEVQQIHVWHADSPCLLCAPKATTDPGITPIWGTALELVTAARGVAATANDPMPMPTPRHSPIVTARCQNVWGIRFRNAQGPDTFGAAVATAFPTIVSIRGAVLDPTR